MPGGSPKNTKAEADTDFMPRELGSKRNVPDRVIDTWVYKVKDVEFEHREWVDPELEPGERDTRQADEKYEMRKERVKNKVVTIEVRLCKTTRQSEEPPHPTEDVHFEVYCEELKLKIEGTDIDALRAAIWDRLDKRFEIKWEQFYLIEVDENRPWGGASGTGIMFEYDTVWRGTTWDGKFLLKKYEGHEFKIKTWPGEFTDKGGKVIACIAATDQNREALEEFCKRMDQMRKVMSDYLRPARIMETLANLSGNLPFLPPAPEGTKEINDEPSDASDK